MRAISLNTLDKYRKYAKHDKNIPNDVLKIKLNCLIDSVEKEHIYNRNPFIVYQFGSCLFYTTDNIISDIRWSDLDNHPTNYEVDKMLKLFSKNGLNKKGNKFLKQQEI